MEAQDAESGKPQQKFFSKTKTVRGLVKNPRGNNKDRLWKTLK